MKLNDTIMFIMFPGVCTCLQMLSEVPESAESTRRSFAGDGELPRVFRPIHEPPARFDDWYRFLVSCRCYLHLGVAVYGLERRLRRRDGENCKNYSSAPWRLEMVKIRPWTFQFLQFSPPWSFENLQIKPWSFRFLKSVLFNYF